MTAARRVAIAGTGSRAQLYTRGLAGRPGYMVAALCDPSPTRMAYHNRLLAGAGRSTATQWPPDGFAQMLAAENITDVVVATVDAQHAHYIIPAVQAGCRVVTEKPMTVDLGSCQAILAAASMASQPLAVGFNYRYNPVHARVWRLLHGGAVGEVLSVHFEWLLDVRHGADYFRRWHRDKASSGGLMVHKAGHHFDLVNWWLGSEPREVFGYGRLGFYGAEAGARHGLRRGYRRAYGSPEAAGDPYALDLKASPGLRELYLDAEADSGYLRDRNVFDGEISIEDDMAVLVRYASGASMSYHLTAYSPWEGYRVMFNGSAGRLELEVVECAWQPPRTAAGRPAAPCTVRSRWPTPVEPRSGCVGSGSRRPRCRWPAITAATAGRTSGCWPRCTARQAAGASRTLMIRTGSGRTSTTAPARWPSAWPPTNPSAPGSLSRSPSQPIPEDTS